MVDSKEDSRKLTLGHLLAQVCRLVGSRRRVKLESIGLHHAQGLILFQLWQEDGISQSVLAQALHITPPTATNTLKRMERDGWVKRRREESDLRIVRVYLTEQSRRLRQEARASFRELDREMTSMLTEQESEALREALLKVHRYLAKLSAAGADRFCSGRAGSRECEEKYR
jgi:MarR family transcriptional regulator, organic hydroperoxide resistance regulator